MRRSACITVLLWVCVTLMATLLLSACSMGDWTRTRLQLRMMEVDPVLLMVYLPDRVSVSRVYDTTAELSLEPRTVDVTLQDSAGPMGDDIIKVINQYAPKMNLRASGVGFSFLSTFDADPRKTDKTGYKLFESLIGTRREAEETTDPFNDPRPVYWLYPAAIPWGNTSATIYHALQFLPLKEQFKARFLILVTIDTIRVVDFPGKLNIKIQFRTRAIDLESGGLVYETVDLFAADNPDGMIGDVESETRTLDELLQDDGAALRNALENSATRYGQHLAYRFSLIDEKQYEELKRSW